MILWRSATSSLSVRDVDTVERRGRTDLAQWRSTIRISFFTLAIATTSKGDRLNGGRRVRRQGDVSPTSKNEPLLASVLYKKRRTGGKRESFA